MEITESGIESSVREEQPPNADPIMLVKPVPRLREVRDEHPLKTHVPIEVTESGMLSSANDEQL